MQTHLISIYATEPLTEKPPKNPLNIEMCDSLLNGVMIVRRVKVDFFLEMAPFTTALISGQNPLLDHDY
jgi:hypothetical protein